MLGYGHNFGAALGVTRSAITLAEIPLEEFINPVGLTVDCQSVPPCGGVAANVLRRPTFNTTRKI